MKNSIKTLVKTLFFKAPKKMKNNHVVLTDIQLEKLKKSLLDNYLDRGNTKKNLSKEEFETAINGQLFERLYYNRNRIAPWLNSIKNLKGLNILEVGCGTGISTLALKEQGANVVGIDVDGGALEVAKDRLKLAGFQDTELYLMNANTIKENFKNKSFDFIIYYAVLEHMTIDERISSLKQAWEILPKGAYLSVIETPNRLWYYDSHTAALPFYDWLPNDLAFYYSKFSGRKNFQDTHKKELNTENLLGFSRWGRGASYHEFELSLEPLNKLNVVSSLMSYEKSTLLKCGFKGMRYVQLLRSLNKNLEKGFCYPYLDIVIQK